MKKLIEESLEKAISYDQYRTLVSDLIEQGKSTGEIQSDNLLNYSILNDKRMNRLDKTIEISENTKNKVKNVKKEQTWLVLTEGWCGDAAQNIPVINKIAEQNSKINLKFVLRDENPELMDQFLTNGGKAIPKLIAIDDESNVLGTWGPRPSEATSTVADYKEKYGKLDPEFKKDLQIWYNKNKGRNTENDLISLFN